MLHPKERLSQEELQRRYNLIRAKMREKGLEALIVSGVRFVGASGYLRYLTNWAEPFGGEILIFPINDAPIFLARTEERALIIKNLLGLKAIAGSTAANTAKIIKEMGYKYIGLCGLNTMFAEFYIQLTKALQEVEMVEASNIINEVRMIKSGEELKWVKKSAHLTDVAFQVFSSLVYPGRSEAEIFIEVDHIVKKLGAENTYFMMAADPKPISKFFDLAFDTYEWGDIVLFNAEIAGPGGYFTQLERTLSLGKPSKEVESAYSVCLKALESGMSRLKPGQRVKDVYWAIRQSIEEEGYKMGLHPGHSQGLDIFERPIINETEETILAEGMVIVLHPHVLLSDGGGIWIGETFLVTNNGPLCFQTSPRNLKVIEFY